VERRPSDGVHHRVTVGPQCRRPGIHALRGDLVLRFLHGLRPVADVVTQLVWREISPGQPGSGFKSDDVDTGLRDWQRSNTAGSAKADDDNVGVFQPSRHDSDS
jgi:hypothetical protein